MTTPARARLSLTLVAYLVAAISRTPHQMARAAEIGVVPSDGDHVAVITLSGEIALSDGKAFADAAQSLGRQRAAVVFGSPGGALLAGLQIGQIIRLHHYATFVPGDTVCASACAFAWLAGAPRIMQPASRIGFHAAYVTTGGTKVETGVGNALVGAYMTTLGLSLDAIVFAETAHPDEISWLTVQTAQKLDIAVRVLPAHISPGDTTPATPVTSPPAPPAASPRPNRGSSVLTPELVGPQPPAANPATSPAEQARRFVSDYFTHWSESNGEAVAFFAGAYAQTVSFYGRTIDRDTVLQGKRDYAERWPVRVYNARPDTIRLFCSAANAVCTVTGVVDWNCRNPARNAASTGAANFSLTVALASGRNQILAEAGSVLPVAN